MIGSLFKRAPGRAAAPGWLAIELGKTSVRLTHVRRDGTGPVVEFAEKRDWNPAEPKSLQRIAREFDAGRFRCTTLLDPAQYQILLVEAPPVKRDELKAALRWKIKDMLDYPVDDATVDMLDLPLPGSAGQHERKMYAVAARNETLRAATERFDKAGIALAVIDIPDTAQRNLAALFEAEQRGVAALTFGEGGGLITVTFGGELYLSRRLDITAQQIVDSAAEDREPINVDLVLKDDEGRGRVFDRVLVEMQRSLDACERAYSFFSLGRVLLGPLPEESGLREHLAANLYIPVETMDPAKVLRLPKGSAGWTPEEANRWLQLIGAGLRSEDASLSSVLE
jgi:MSHA biogenesis protein MshI